MRNHRSLSWRTGAALFAGAGACLIAALAMITASPAESADPSALWHIVHDLCVPDMKANRLPAPCSAVDLAGGYAVLKDIRGATQLLLIPTDRIGGIESPRLLDADVPNYWQDAWDALPLFERRVGRPVPRQDVGLAINSVFGRTQDQLHIHIDCVRPEVQQALAANAAGIGARWSVLDVPLAGRRYRVMRLEGSDLGRRDPFKLLAKDPAARADMGRETLVVIGAVFAGGRPGFVLLSDRADMVTFDKASGESLLDHECKVLTAPATPG